MLVNETQSFQNEKGTNPESNYLTSSARFGFGVGQAHEALTSACYHKTASIVLLNPVSRHPLTKKCFFFEAVMFAGVL